MRALTDTLTRLLKRAASVVLMIFRKSKGCQAGKVAWIHEVVGNDVETYIFDNHLYPRHYAPYGRQLWTSAVN